MRGDTVNQRPQGEYSADWVLNVAETPHQHGSHSNDCGNGLKQRLHGGRKLHHAIDSLTLITTKSPGWYSVFTIRSGLNSESDSTEHGTL